MSKCLLCHTLFTSKMKLGTRRNKAMKSLNEYIGQELHWVHPNLLSAEYELRAGDEVLARLHWKGALTSQVVAETADGSWAIERKGIGQTITVLALDAHTELATITRGMSGQSTLHFAD